MSTGFDPYHKWLGIPPDEQPPHYYRLLSIGLYESDPDVIESAADRQMAYLRTFQAGKHSALSQKLLNEVASAKICLLNVERKASYDRQLRAWMEPAAGAASRATWPPQPPPIIATPEDEVARELSFLSDDAVQAAGHHAAPNHVHSAGRHSHATKRSLNLQAALVVGFSVLAVGLAASVWLLVQPQKPDKSGAAGGPSARARTTPAPLPLFEPQEHSKAPSTKGAAPTAVGKWQGALLSLVSHGGETHLLVQPPGVGGLAVEAFTREPEFARQLIDYAVCDECVQPTSETIELEGVAATESPLFRLRRKAALVQLKSVMRSGEPATRAEVGKPRDPASVARLSPMAPLVDFVRIHPAAGTEVKLPLRYRGYSTNGCLEAMPDGARARESLAADKEPPPNWMSWRVALRFPQRTNADFFDYQHNERVWVQAVVGAESTPGRLVLHVNAVWREADPARSRITAQGRAAPPSDAPGRAPAKERPGGDASERSPQAGVQVRSWSTKETNLKHLLWTPDGRHLISCGALANSHPMVWTADSGQCVRTLSAPADASHAATDMCCHPKGKELMAATSGGLASWSILTGDVAARWTAPRPPSFNGEPKAYFAVSPDGTQLAMMYNTPAAADKWNFGQGPLATGVRTVNSGVNDSSNEFVLRWGGDHNGRLAVGSPQQGVISCFACNISKGPTLMMLIHAPGMPPATQPALGGMRRLAKPVPQRPGRQLCDIAWSRDGNSLAVAGEFIEIWSMAKAPVLKRKVAGADGQLFRRVSWSPDGTRVAAAWARGAAVWDVESGEQQFAISVQNTEPLLAWSPVAEELAIVDESGQLRIFRTAHEKPAPK